VCVCVHALWLSRYYRDNIEAIRVESAGTEGDRSFTSRVRVLTTSSKFQKNQKEKKRNQEEEREEDDEN